MNYLSIIFSELRVIAATILAVLAVLEIVYSSMSLWLGVTDHIDDDNNWGLVWPNDPIATAAYDFGWWIADLCRGRL